MTDIEKLESMYEKEVRLAKQHRDKAADLKQKIEEGKGQAILKSIKNIRLSPEEFKKLQKKLANEEDVKQFIKTRQADERGDDEDNGEGTKNPE